MADSVAKGAADDGADDRRGPGPVIGGEANGLGPAVFDRHGVAHRLVDRNRVDHAGGFVVAGRLYTDGQDSCGCQRGWPDQIAKLHVIPLNG